MSLARTRSILALSLILVALSLLAVDVSGADNVLAPDYLPEQTGWWSFERVQTTGDDYFAVMARRPWYAPGHGYYIGVVTGLVAREVADGPVEQLTVPVDDERLRVFDPLFNLVSPNMFNVDLAVSQRLNEVDYDPLIDDAIVAAWDAFGTRTDYPWSVASFTLDGDGPSARSVLFVSDRGDRIYVVSEPLLLRATPELAP